MNIYAKIKKDESTGQTKIIHNAYNKATNKYNKFYFITIQLSPKICLKS